MEEVKKAKKKTIPCVYGEKEPKTVNELNANYMKAFLAAKVADGTITKKQVAAYKKKKNDEIAKEENPTATKKSHIERKVFVDMFMPELKAKKKEKIDFDAELDAIING